MIPVAECEWGRGGGGCGQETAEGGRLKEGGAQSHGRRKIQVGGPWTWPWMDQWSMINDRDIDPDHNTDLDHDILLSLYSRPRH